MCDILNITTIRIMLLHIYKLTFMSQVGGGDGGVTGHLGERPPEFQLTKKRNIGDHLNILQPTLWRQNQIFLNQNIIFI